MFCFQRVFIEEKLGVKYVEGRSVEFAKSFEETSPTTPIFFILSPGVNPLKVILIYFYLFSVHSFIVEITIIFCMVTRHKLAKIVGRGPFVNIRDKKG